MVFSISLPVLNKDLKHTCRESWGPPCKRNREAKVQTQRAMRSLYGLQGWAAGKGLCKLAGDTNPKPGHSGNRHSALLQLVFTQRLL